jgi:hypothetical protein
MIYVSSTRQDLPLNLRKRFQRLMNSGYNVEPTQDRRMSDMQPAFGHHREKTTKDELLEQVPAHAQNDLFPVEVPTYKQLFQAGRINRRLHWHDWKRTK